jgi:transcriptional regulator with XRE-family HTH domain
MPPCTPLLALFVKARWSTYLRGLTTADRLTKSAIARNLDVPVSRVTQWLNGERLVVAETAFDIGEALREKLGLETSGVEALYACGYLAEVLLLLKHLSVDLAAEGDLLAVDIYSWLPGSMFSLEHAMVNAQFAAAARHGIESTDILRSNLREYVRLGTELDLYAYNANEHAAPRGKIAATLRSPAARATIVAAWQDVHTGRLRATNALPKTETVRRRGVTRSQEVLALLRGVPLPELPDIFVEVTQARKFELNTDGNAAFIDAVIDVARQSRSAMPSLCAPRLWRMIAEWASYVDEERFLARRGLMPHSFRTYEDRPITEREALHLDRLQDMRDGARGK